MPRQKTVPVNRKHLYPSENNSIIVDGSSEIAVEESNPKRPRRDVKPKCVLRVTEDERTYYLNKFTIGTCHNIVPEQWEKCSIQCYSEKLKLCFDKTNNAVVSLSDVVEIDTLKELFGMKILKFSFNVNFESQLVELWIYLSAVQSLKLSKKAVSTLQWVMEQFFQVDMSDVYEEIKLKTHENIECLYEQVAECRKRKNIFYETKLNCQHPHLVPELREYQCDAVKWMIHQEKMSKTIDILHPLYLGIKLLSSAIIYYNKFTGNIQFEPPMVKLMKTGGILADEMGLGKTVEVLACILNNPRELETNGSEEIFAVTKIDAEPEDKMEIEEKETDELVPNIETQQKYRRPKDKKMKQGKNPQLYKNMSATRKAAQIWYEKKLAEMLISPKRIRDRENEVKCICGDLTMTGIIRCKDCNKMQHTLCMGYKGEQENYLCTQCWTKKPLIKSKATLIVSPQSISRQWLSEVQRHVRKNGLKVLEYNGIHSAGLIYPTNLADYDLVVTTYSVLQSELKFTEEEASVSLRYAKRYNAPNTPLLCIEWWRLCLDEAQNVECPNDMVSCMARQLQSIHRWAVTGTPMPKSISDLYGLANYLNMTPYDDANVWNYHLFNPYVNGNKTSMIEFLSDILWRTRKNDVLDQINIPPQKIQEHWLEFSAVEKFFYNREHEACAQDFLAKLKNFKSLDIVLSTIDRNNIKTILSPLISLRQACIHPYAVRGRFLGSKRQVNSMEDLLDSLINQNSIDCTEALRAINACLNGMAGMLLLQQRYLDAVEKYRTALWYMSEYENKCNMKADKLQRIHTLYNLNQVLFEFKSVGIPPTLRDDKLKEECERYQCLYMDKYIGQSKSAIEEAKHATNKVDKVLAKFIRDEGEWFQDLVDYIVENDQEKELLRKLHSFVNDTNFTGNDKNISGARQLVYVLVTWNDRVVEMKKKLQESFKKFYTTLRTDEKNNSYYIKDEMINDATDCHLRPKKKKQSNPCLCCKVDIALKKYECLLFQMNTKRNEMQSNQGNWLPIFQERVLKMLFTFGKTIQVDQEILYDAEVHIKLAELRRKEFIKIRKVYTHLYQQIAAQDELNICKIRYRLKNPEEPMKVIQKKQNSALKNLDYEIENKYEFINILNEYELDVAYNVMKMEKTSHDISLKKLIGTHTYLETLKKQQYDGQDPDPCPICKTQLKDTWSILHCGHCYCLSCIHILLKQNLNEHSVTCSVCRKKQLFYDVSYIRIKEGDENTVDDVEIKGSYSTKFHAIVRFILQLTQTDEDVKILIFSTWQPVLRILSDALKNNSLKNELVLSTQKLQEKLSRFKERTSNITALLMPVSLGANGLNLVEATHIILVEPLMNPGEELQAIGRIHRIGQTKPTVVHKFLIKSTIEENIHHAISSNVQQWEDQKLTLTSLKGLFSKEELSDSEEISATNNGQETEHCDDIPTII